MLETPLFSILIASILGVLAGLGVGGGSLLVLWLTLILDYSYTEARIMNLLFFIPAAVIASLFRWKQGSLNLAKILPAMIAGCIAAAVFSLLGKSWDLMLIKKIFGGLLLITGIRELLYKGK